MGQVEDVSHCVTMDLKTPGNRIYQVGMTHDEMGGSHFAQVLGLEGGQAPKVDAPLAKKTFAALHQAINTGLVRACHDLSEGGLAVAAAEMAFAGGCGTRISLAQVPNDLESASDAVLLYSESNTRFLCEVTGENAEAFEKVMGDVPCTMIGEVTDTDRLEIVGLSQPIADGRIGGSGDRHTHRD